MTAEIENLLQELEKTANFLRGLALDPAVPAHAKEAIGARTAAIDAVTERDDFPLGEACDLSNDKGCEACQ